MTAIPTIPATAPEGTRVIRSRAASDGEFTYALAARITAKNMQDVADAVGARTVVSEWWNGHTETLLVSGEDRMTVGDWAIIGADARLLRNREINREFTGLRGGALSGR